MLRICLGAAALLATTAACAASCGDLAGKSYGPATIIAATSVVGPSSFVGKDPPQPTALDAPFCRIEGVIKPTSDSDIRFEVWLPPAEKWNGKLEAVGNGGFAGSLIYPSMKRALDQGYATTATDTGHEGGPLDAGWALGHPERISDFGWRGVHETAIASKAVVAEYYGKAATHAYFAGCSDGGREALIEAQRFPKDFNGIVAGAPASAWNRLFANALADHQALSAPDAWLSPDDLALVTKETLAACGGENGVLPDPLACHFDPANLTCKSGQNSACLGAAKVAALKAIYAGPKDAKGVSIFPGFAQGGETGGGAWSAWLTGTEPKRLQGTLLYFFASGFFSNFVYDRTITDLTTLTLDQALADATTKTAKALDAQSFDLMEFKAAGGKLIQYHGWNDAAIPPAASIQYYQSVAARMGGEGSISPFYRLFMAPGMEHCGGGPGANAIGGVFGLPTPKHDPAHDVVAAIAHWVEDGVAPDSLTATLYTDNDPGKGVASERAWSAYKQH
jgi:Tannase and feruloyl esterase